MTNLFSIPSDLKKIKKEADQYLIPVYGDRQAAFIRGKGTKLWDASGKEYLDFVSGISVCNLGHSHPEVTKAICTQAKRLLHTSNLYYIMPQIQLAKLLCQHSFADRCFFCNSGAEANEAAIKLARKFAKENFGKDRFQIICFEDSFHGRTLATLAATGQKKYQIGFEPLPVGFVYAKFNDLTSVEKKINRSTCAIMVEPIQGEGGINVATHEFFVGLRRLCDENNLLLILDEVQTGLGRTGKLFAYQHYGIEPDIMTLAKALGNGVPIGALLTTDRVAKSFTKGSHASTFGGNFLATVAGYVTLSTIIKEKLYKRAQRLGNYFLTQLLKLKEKYSSIIKDVRGKGLMIGVELSIPGNLVVSECLNRGILINCVKEMVLRFLPPLIVTKEEINKVISVLEDVFKDLKEKGKVVKL